MGPRAWSTKLPGQGFVGLDVDVQGLVDEAAVVEVFVVLPDGSVSRERFAFRRDKAHRLLGALK